MEIAQQQAKNLLYWGRNNPGGFMANVLGADLWETQERIALSVRDNRYTTVYACHGPGKTYLAAHIALWYLYTFYPSKVITTAPTHRQVYSLLWQEIRAAHKKAESRGTPLGGEALKTRLELAPNWFAEGFSTSDYDTEKVTGYHSDHILIIIDEASGVPDNIIDSAEGLMASGHARMLLVGNPNRASGRFYDSSFSKLYSKIKISAYDTPNFTHFGITREDILNDTWRNKITGELPRPYLVTPEWVAERVGEWGADSLLTRVKIDAEFPNTEDEGNIVIPAGLAIQMQERKNEHDAQYEKIEVGVDVARYGDDESMIAYRAGRAALEEEIISKRDTMELTGCIIQGCRRYGWDRILKIKIDVIGLGVAPVDRLKEIQREGDIPDHVEIIGVNVAVTPKDKKRFATHRDEIWWEMRELVKDGEIGGAGISDITLKELSATKYTINSRGLIKVESKEELRKPNRLGKSPDRADAWILAYVDCKAENAPAKIKARSISIGRRK